MAAKKTPAKAGGTKTAGKGAAPAKPATAKKPAPAAAKPEKAAAKPPAAVPRSPVDAAKKAAAPKAPPPAPPKKPKPAPARESVATAERAPAADAPPAKPIQMPRSLPPRRADGTITLAHSPDADDAFMFYALAAGKVDTEDRLYHHVLEDIQSLNARAKNGEFDVTALSFHAYPYVQQNYRLLTCGASFGDGYGPVLVAKSPIRPAEVEGLTVAIPGEWTTAALVTRLWFGRAKIKAVPVPFDKIVDAVRSGLTRAGVLIHEAQLTFRAHGLVKVVDFGQWWTNETEGLPLPLGGNGIRRDISAALAAKIALDLKRSIAYALGHREEALDHAMKYARDLPRDQADKFVGLYVNDLTLDYGERGRQALGDLFRRAVAARLIPFDVTPEFIS
jgi:1,4-dihydroxy-6-naphthoate synthase